MPSVSAVENFIVSAFRSVWALDVVQLLHAYPDKIFSHSELVETLRASDLVVNQSVHSLTTAGLAVNDDAGVRLHSVDAKTDQLLQAAIGLYRSKPDRVRRLIVARSLPGVTAFSDAFKLRKD